MLGKTESNFGLSEEQFDRLREQLRQGDETLFTRIFVQQFAAAKRYLITEDAAAPDDAYDATMDALLKLRQGLVSGAIGYGNLRYLFTRMARQQYYRNQQKASPYTDDEMPSIPNPPEEVKIDADTYRLLARSWKGLEDKCRSLLLAIFYRQESAEAIAKDRQLPSATVRKQKQRCLEKLRATAVKTGLRAER